MLRTLLALAGALSAVALMLVVRWWRQATPAEPAFMLRGCEVRAALADRDGDGWEDLALVRTGDERVSVELCSSADGTVLAAFEVPGSRDAYWLALAEVDDLDGDARGEIAVADPKSQAERGSVAVFGAHGTLLFKREGEAGMQRFGSGLFALDDMDGDGLRDLATAFVREADGTGRVLLLSGRNGSSLAEFAAPMDAPVDDLAAAGDWNRDGYGDLLVVTRSASSVVDARTGEKLADLPGGYSACGGRDADGDGAPDVAVGDWPQVALVSSATGELLSEWRKRFYGLDSFATSVAFADLAGDGRAELVIGSPDHGIDGGRPHDIGELRVCSVGLEEELYLEEGSRVGQSLGLRVMALRGRAGAGDRIAVGSREGVGIYPYGSF